MYYKLQIKTNIHNTRLNSQVEQSAGHVNSDTSLRHDGRIVGYLELAQPVLVHAHQTGLHQEVGRIRQNVRRIETGDRQKEQQVVFRQSHSERRRFFEILSLVSYIFSFHNITCDYCV